MIPSDNVSSADADVLIQLRQDHQPSNSYIRRMREQLPLAFPGGAFYFQTADIASQVLNFGQSSTIDIQINDNNFDRAYVLAQKLMLGLRKIPGVVDPHVPQIFDSPTLQVDVDRLRAAQLGISQRDISNNVLVSLSSSWWWHLRTF